VKTDKAFYRPIYRVVHAHLKSLMPEVPRHDAPVFLEGGARPNARFQALCGLAGIRAKLDIETGKADPGDHTDARCLRSKGIVCVRAPAYQAGPNAGRPRYAAR
jgi:hypothetical protein